MDADMQNYQGNGSTKIQQILSSYIYTEMIYVAIELRLPDILDDVPRKAASLAEIVDVEPQAFNRFLQGLVMIGLIAEDDEQYTLTEVGKSLRTRESGSIRDLALFHREVGIPTWRELLYSIKTGKPSFEHVFGRSFFDYLEEHRLVGRTFNLSMNESTAIIADAISAEYDFTGIKIIADIGGGQGGLIGSLLKSHPSIEAILFESALAASDAEEYLRSIGVADRCVVMVGDFFDRVPGGYDVYLLSHVLHDWSDDSALRILRNIRNAIPSHGKLLLVEALVQDSGDQSSFVIKRDLSMLVLTGGRERTEKEYNRLLNDARFSPRKSIPIQPGRIMIEAFPIGD